MGTKKKVEFDRREKNKVRMKKEIKEEGNKWRRRQERNKIRKNKIMKGDEEKGNKRRSKKNGIKERNDEKEIKEGRRK